MLLLSAPRALLVLSTASAGIRRRNSREGVGRQRRRPPLPESDAGNRETAVADFDFNFDFARQRSGNDLLEENERGEGGG